MRTLVVGAGALGGYFGGRLLAAHRDVTFLVRPPRAAELAHSGLQIRSPFGDLSIPAPPTVLAKDLSATFDLVLLSCKAYDLENALDSFAPAVGPATVILPVLNGMRHLDILDSRFGSGHTLAGYCFIAANLNERHQIVHLNDRHTLSFGERDGSLSDRVKAIETFLRAASFDVKESTTGILEMWEKWVFLATLAGSTCLMRASVGQIVSSPGGREFMVNLLAECRAIATAAGYPPTEGVIDAVRNLLTAEASTLTASMLRDIEKQGPIEADHVIGDLLIRGEHFGLPPNTLPLLANVYTNLKAYEARRQRLLNLVASK
jgi:2-dehydropantoate 2-reductase